MIKKYSLVLVAFLCFVFCGFGQVILTNPITGTNPNLSNPYTTGQTVAANLTVSGIGRGAGALGTNANDRYNANSWNTPAIDFTAYFEFTLVPNAGYQINFTNFVYTGQTSDTGPTSFAFRSSVDGYASNLGIPTIAGTTISLVSGSFQNVTSSITFRLYGWGASASIGTFSINDFTFNGSVTPISTNFVDYCNLQFPLTGNIPANSTFNVYARVYEAGVTEATGQGAGISGWIGYSTTNSDPSTWPMGNWVNATYNTDSGNHDEYVANIGPLLSSGNYYYASRFQISGGPYRYGGYDVGGGNGFWDGTNDVSGVLSVDTVDFANLQFPSVGTIAPGGTFDVYGQVYEEGVTPGSGRGAGIVAEIGYSTTNTNPNTWTNWVATTYNSGCTDTCNSLQNDEYQANLGISLTLPGTYYYATRFKLNNGVWLYGGILANGTAGNFWDGTAYISGVVNVVAPEINIRKNTNTGTIPNGVGPSTGYNTVFAAETIGNTSSGKTFYIHNEGTANLTVNSISSSNAGEFPVTVISPVTFPTTIAPGNFIEFEIAFAPATTIPNPRISTITVVNNDSDENPYTFGVRGTANCTASAITINPINGPVGTVVTVQGTNFGGATTANFNGTPVTMLSVLSSTLIEVTVPSGATTGSLQVTNQIGCKSSVLFAIINNQIASCQGTSGSLPTSLFISEVTDKGTGSHSYIEIYNGTGASIDMGALNYQLRIHNNGASTSTASINLTGPIANNTVKVVAIGGTDAISPEGGYIANFFNGTGGINDDDHIRLYRGATWVDLWGETTGNAFTITSKDYVYRRKNSGIIVPSTSWNPNDWESFTPVDYSNIKIYDFSVGIPPSVTVQPIAPISSCDLTATLSVTASEGFSGGFSLAFQWYVSATLPAATEWTAINDVGVYSGANTSTLSISSTLNLDNYQYYCQVREDAATCYTASNAVRVKVQKSTWDGVSWSPTAPTMGSIAILNGNYDMTVLGDDRPSFSACQLLINSGFTLTIEDNKFVEVENNVTVDGTINLKSKGAFVQNNNSGLVNGAVLVTRDRIIVEKLTAPLNNWYEYTYWSSPVVGETIGAGLAESKPNRRFSFNAANFKDSYKEMGNNNAALPGQDDIDDNGDDWTLVSAGTIMTPGVGYAATLDPIGFIGAGTQYQFTFEGRFNNGIITVPIYRNDTETNDNNWNFIGNPYPSAISADDFLAANTVLNLNVPSGSIDGAIFLWSQNTPPSGTTNGNQNLNFAQSDYAIINGTGQTAGGGDLVPPSRFIPSGQGFFVSMANAAPSTVVNGDIKTTTVTFNNSMRVTNNNSQFFRNSENNSLNNKLWINLTSNNGVFNQILVGYVYGATDGNDGMYYDAAKNLSTGANCIIYTLIEGNQDLKLAIQGKHPNSLTLDEIIPLGFYTSITQPTTYRLSIADFQGEFFNANTVYLKDNLLGLNFNLSASDYIFSSQNGEFNNRFEIAFRDQSLSVLENEITPNGLSIIELPSGQVKFVVGNDLNILSVEISDMLGRTLYNLKGNSPSEVYQLSNLSRAAYMAKVTLSNGQVISKRAVKRK